MYWLFSTKYTTWADIKRFLTIFFMLETCFNFPKYVSLSNIWVVTLISFTDLEWKIFLLVNYQYSGEPVNGVTNCCDFAIKVHILVTNIHGKSLTLCFLYLELKTVGKWTHHLYTYYELMVNKKQSIWEKKVNWFTHYSAISTIIQILLN